MSSLYFDIEKNKWPIVYDEKYNVSFMGLEKLHVFDAQKWRNIIQVMKRNILESVLHELLRALVLSFIKIKYSYDDLISKLKAEICLNNKTFRTGQTIIPITYDPDYEIKLEPRSEQRVKLPTNLENGDALLEFKQFTEGVRMPTAIVECENYFATTVIQNTTDNEIVITITSPFKVVKFVENTCMTNNMTDLNNVEMDALLTENLSKLRLNHLNKEESDAISKLCHEYKDIFYCEDLPLTFTNQHLMEAGLITQDCIVKPNEAKTTDLLVVHTKKYLDSLKWSFNVAVIAEVPVIAFLPNRCVKHSYLKPMRRQTGGSILAGKLALERGWAINVGGGFHHCSAERGGGFCPYADITLLIQFLINNNRIQNAMIVDLDAHQGNGYQHDFLGVPEVYIMDVYNRNIYPRDREAKKAIRRKVELNHKVEDLEYLLKVRQNLKAALSEFRPDILVYNAGTDILDTDPLGNMRISEIGIIRRDELVFEMCKENKIPIVMLTSGGYLKKTAGIIAHSIINLHRRGLIDGASGES